MTDERGGEGHGPIDLEAVRRGRELVREVAARLARQLGGVVPASDLESAGDEALVTLLRAYDPTASPLDAYLRRFLRWAMLDAARSLRREFSAGRRARGLAACAWLSAAGEDPECPAPEVPPLDALRAALEARALALVLSTVGARVTEVAADSTERPDRLVARESEHAFVRRTLFELEDESLRDVLVRHYFADEPLASIATALGLSPTQVCRLHRRALDVLGRALRNDRLPRSA